MITLAFWMSPCGPTGKSLERSKWYTHYPDLHSKTHRLSTASSMKHNAGSSDMFLKVKLLKWFKVTARHNAQT